MNRMKLSSIYENEEDLRLARILSILIWASWGVFLFAILINLYYQDWDTITGTLAGSALLVVPFVLLRRRHLHASSLVMVLIELGTVTFIATTGQGIRDVAVLGYPIIFIFAGLVLNRVYFRLCIGLTLVAVCWLVFGEAFGWFATKPFIGSYTIWFYLIGVTLILLLTALAVDLLRENMSRSLELARSEVAERKQMEEKLQEERILLRTVIDNIPDRIYAMDTQGRKTISNTADWQASGGKTMEDVIGKTDLDTYPSELAKDYWALDKEVIDSGKSILNREEPGLDPQGKPVSVLSSKVPLRDSQGKIIGLVGIGRDITERKQGEEKIRQLNSELELRVEERTRELRVAQEQLLRKEKLAVLGQMAGSVGHELRNPLGVINNAIYYLELVQPKADGKIKEHLEIIKQEVHNAEKIITDLLDFARIKSVEREPLSVGRLVQQTLERFTVPADVKVKLELPDDLPDVLADPRQMEQVLGNLTTNACQAMMPKGGRMTISASVDHDFVRLAVIDTGMGIPAENMSNLFEPLFTTKVQGIGLGLAVSEKLIEANGGRIEVESEVGKGSTFTAWLPVVLPESK